eukprot:m.29966 g.29966  ORF g.29966 m.29966 type:complete len:701 (-) comp9220_c1_seq2:221-2323(-)
MTNMRFVACATSTLLVVLLMCTQRVQANTFESTNINDVEIKDSAPAMSEMEQQAVGATVDEAFVLLKTSESLGVNMMLKLGQAGDVTAQVWLGVTALLGNSSYWPPSTKTGVEWLSKAADQGSPAAQFFLGALYSTGVGVERDQAQAVLYYTFSAFGGDFRGQMALGYRYMFGNNVEKSCRLSLSNYQRAANQVQGELTSAADPPQFVERKRIAAQGQPAQQSTDEEIAEFTKYRADSGDVDGQRVAGQLYYVGQGFEQNLDRARHYFERAANGGDPHAYAFLGEMYANGFGVKQDNETSVQYLRKAAKMQSPMGQHALGLMYLNGQGVKKDVTSAIELISKAAKNNFPDAQYTLGTLHYSGTGVEKDPSQALTLFKSAAQQGHILGMYNLAMMHSTGAGVSYDCKVGRELFKNVAERGAFGSEFPVAYTAYENEQYDEAILRYLLLGEMGFEVAQFNAAQLIDQGLTTLFVNESLSQTAALQEWKWSAQQGHSPSRVKVGDAFYYGKGVSVDKAAATEEYREASDALNAQALFNLGIMHHFGDGLEKDIHLAKRYYDRTLEVSTQSALPVYIVLSLLYATFGWEWLQEQVESIEFSTDTLQSAVASVDLDSLIQRHSSIIIALLCCAFIAVYLARNLALHRHQTHVAALNRAYEQRLAAYNTQQAELAAELAAELRSSAGGEDGEDESEGQREEGLRQR